MTPLVGVRTRVSPCQSRVSPVSGPFAIVVATTATKDIP
jgi:hypothetical protein